MWAAAGLISGLILLLVAVCFLVIVIHEFGHAVAARVTGTRVLSIKIGSSIRLVTMRIRGVPLTLHALPLRGLTRVNLPSTRTRYVVLTLGGPVANAAMALMCLVLAAWLGPVFLVLGVGNALGVASLLPVPPHTPKHVGSDGWVLCGLVFRRDSYRERVDAAAKSRRLPITLQVEPPGEQASATNPASVLALDLALRHDTASVIADSELWAERAVSLDPEDVVAQNALALVRIRQNRVEEGEARVRTLLRALPDNAELRIRSQCELTLALALCRLGDQRGAKELTEWARVHIPRYPLVAELQELLETSQES
ncbi:MAG TPA: M50 family metallopeptidase [Acidimicrobiales bacterium]